MPLRRKKGHKGKSSAKINLMPSYSFQKHEHFGAAKSLFVFGFLFYLAGCLSIFLLLSFKVPNEKFETIMSPNSMRKNHLRRLLAVSEASEHRSTWHPIQIALGSSHNFTDIMRVHPKTNEFEDHLTTNFEGIFMEANETEGDGDDELDSYYATDDDTVRGQSEEKLQDKSEFCTPPSFYRMYNPSCNEVHASAGGHGWLEPKHTRYLASGTYRDVFVIERNYSPQLKIDEAGNSISDSTDTKTEKVIFKTMRQIPNSNRKHPLEEVAAYEPDGWVNEIELYDDMRKDSMVMELLSSSPRIANIYSFCGMSSFIEFAPGNVEHDVMQNPIERTDDEPPLNKNIPPKKKLEMALEMAKSIAAMHGFSGGPIAHVDVQLGQFCRGQDGIMKLVDFNRAEVLLFDIKQEKYCSFSNGVPPDGSYRAPEEIIDAPLDEKIDVYSLGNNFYGLLTGLYVNDDYDIEDAHWRITHGETEEIDLEFYKSCSLAEYTLAKAILWCWTFEAELRPSIFDIVDVLEKAIKV